MIKITRLPNTRKGKTAVDVTVTNQNNLKRVRLTMGADSYDKKNTDMDEREVEDLITILSFKLAMIRGQVPWDEAEVDVSEDYLSVRLSDFRRVGGYIKSHIGEVIIQASKGKHGVWFDSYDKALAEMNSDTKTQSVYGHMTAEDARILGETLIKAAEIAEGKL